MTSVTIHEAKTQLSRLIREALEGGEVTIRQGRSGQPLVRLVPAQPSSKRMRVGGWLAHNVPRGKDMLEDGFWDPLPDDHLGL
jgi:prevent-host-death family protein